MAARESAVYCSSAACPPELGVPFNVFWPKLLAYCLQMWAGLRNVLRWQGGEWMWLGDLDNAVGFGEVGGCFRVWFSF